ncbi:MAG: hypothetical protein JNL72_08775 [Flavipsychrobacter sp.]|nr:hypothetical protein [Flavipsychrobacter sp.]
MNLFLLLFMLLGISQADNGIKNVSKYKPSTAGSLHMNDPLEGIWKMKEDTDTHNYFVLQKDKEERKFIITYMNRSGDNRGLEHGGLYFMDVKGTTYIACSNWIWEKPGYFFMKVTEVGKFKLTAQLVVDTNIYKMKSDNEMRAHFEKNATNNAFVGEPVHFVKKFTFNDWK